MKKRRAFRASKEVKAIARERIGAPPPAKVRPDSRRKRAKHPKRELERDA
jgi:hypothetical protein